MTRHPYEPAPGVEAAHQRMHATLDMGTGGEECPQEIYGERHYNVMCMVLECAYAALDVQPPDARVKPWEAFDADGSPR
jgi:hypothetical protein